MSIFLTSVIVVSQQDSKILLQHRTDDAPWCPGQWCFPGGHLEPGEDPVTCAHRELLEETGLTVERLVSEGAYQLDDERTLYVYVGSTTATQDDVICGEGQAMVFLTPNEMMAKDLSPATRQVIRSLMGWEAS
jgi:mutator protein MutT